MSAELDRACAGDMFGRALGMPFDAYIQEAGISNSGLKDIARSPALYKWKRDNPSDKQTPAMLLGSATHCRILEPSEYASRYCVDPAPGSRSKAATERRTLIRDTGAEILTVDQDAKVQGMREAVANHRMASTLLAHGNAELSYWWDSPDYPGTLCKARADFINDAHESDILVDVKTTSDASPEAFAKSVVNFKYHQQAAWYLDGWAAVTGKAPAGFIFVAVESEPPFQVATYTLDDEDIALGRALYRRALATYVECIESDQWPGYSVDEIQTLVLPAWAYKL